MPPPASRRSSLPIVALASAVAAFASLSSDAHAAPNDTPTTTVDASAPREDAARDEARALFRLGVKLEAAGDTAGAAEAFVGSFRRFPSPFNAVNAGASLDKLGQYDEALDYYEAAIVRFNQELSPSERAILEAAVPRVRANVATLVVSANVSGRIVVDGRQRGTLPLAAPLRLLAGRHRLRIVESGYAAFERELSLQVGENPAIDARLAPLGELGAVRVESTSLEGAPVFVDGSSVGDAPWEGRLPAGAHVIQLATESSCSPLIATTVVQGQTTLVRAAVAPAGRAFRVQTTPFSAALAIDDVRVGAGAWEGRLPVGAHALSAREEGYVARTVQLASSAAGEERRVELALAVDERHPRWKAKGARAPGSPFVALAVGGAYAPTMHGGADQRCGLSCSDVPGATGAVALARAGYELRSGLAFEVTAGALTLGRETRASWGERYVAAGAPQTVRFTANDRTSLTGALVLGGASYGVPIRGALSVRTRIAAGALLGRYVSELDATVGSTTSDARALAVVRGGQLAAASTPFVVAPSLELEYRAGAVRVSFGVTALFALTSGPARGGVTVVPSQGPCTQSTTASPACARASDYLSRPFAGEDARSAGYRTYGPFVTLLPTLGVRFDP